MSRPDDVPEPELFAPVKAVRVDKAFDDWPFAWCCGAGYKGGDWYVVTDHVRASEMADLDFPSEAEADAKAIAALINAYREGRLVWKEPKARAILSQIDGDT